ncbi:hypothetical protein BLAT2472_100026 [Burkholderia latens]
MDCAFSERARQNALSTEIRNHIADAVRIGIGTAPDAFLRCVRPTPGSALPASVEREPEIAAAKKKKPASSGLSHIGIETTLRR